MRNFDNDFHFNPNEVEDTINLIPPGDYVAVIIEAEPKVPRSGDGHMLALTWAITEGDHENRRIWQTLCYHHSNRTTQDIARKGFKRICVALGITEAVRDPEVLMFRPMRVQVDVEVDKKGQYDDKNVIRKVRPLTEGDNEATEARAQASKNGGGDAASKKPTATSTSRASTTPTTAGPGTPPWKKPAA